MTNQPLPPLARSDLDRDYLSRENPELFDVLWAEPETKVLAMFGGRVLVSDLEDPALILMPTEQVPSANLRVYLGRTRSETRFAKAGAAIVLAVLNENAARLLEPKDENWHSLRKIGGFLGSMDAGLFTQSLALANWHQSSAHCPSCGQPTVIEKGGWVRRCFNEDREIFPRTDPAIIVAIIDEQDRILLGSQASWERNRWSILAGFVEPGESLEAAVVREMAEESGLSVSDPHYVYSQGWPYPLSLMLGFTARADSNQMLKPDGEEIVTLRWFSREDIAKQSEEMILPPYSSISRALIERWYGRAISSANETSSNGQQ